MKRSILVAALVAGTLAGAAGAAVNAQEPTPAPPAPRATATPVPVPTAERRGRDDQGRYDPAYVHFRVRNVSYPVRVEDPAGGLPWVVKAFDADRIGLRRPATTLKGGHVYGRNRCFQVGRLQGRTFGWVYGDGVFRRTGPDDELMQCMGRTQRIATARLINTLAITDPAAPRIAGSVVYGLLPAAGAITIRGTGGADGAATVRAGVFLRVAGPDAHPLGTVTGGGRTIPINPLAGLPGSSNLKFPTLIAGTQRAEAPAPDPAGGPRWVLPVAETREGVPCVGQATRVVEDRPGDVDLARGLFNEHRLTSGACRPLSTRPRPDLPCDLGWSSSAEHEPALNDPFLARALAERRLQPGRSAAYAQCSDDVVRVTVQTPRDVRTLVPSPVGRAVLAVYDGEFVDGTLKVTAHRRDGTTWAQESTFGF